MKKKLILPLVAALLLSSFLLSGCGNGSSLTVGVRTNLDNFSTYNESADMYYGFEADFAAALAKEMGYSGVRYVGLLADDRESALENEDVDCIVAAYSYTDERAEKYDLSTPYYNDEGRVMVEKSSLFTDYADLEGATVAVRVNTTARAHLTEKLAELGLIADESDKALSSFLTIAEYETYDEMNAALESGEVDAVCADGALSMSWLGDGRIWFDQAYSAEDYVVATAQGSKLSAKIDSAVVKLVENGTVASLMEKWGV